MSNNPHGRTRGLLLMVVAPSGVGKTSLTRRLVADHNDLHLSISATTFLEWAEVYGNHYGSPRGPIVEALERGESVLFDIDFQGAMKVHAQLPEDSVLIYVLPPSLAEMSRRLHARSQDSEEVIAKRLARAKDEVAAWERFDYVILNDDFDRAYSDLAHIYHAERQKRARNPWIGNLVDDLLQEEI
jgi:guanylate kinase